MSNVSELELKNAESLLAMAKADWDAGMCSSSPYSICFHAQQSAEKNLKAYLVVNGCEVPRTHDLVKLVDIATKYDNQFSRLREQAELLAPYGVKIRYIESKEIADTQCSTVWNAMSAINEVVLSAFTRLYSAFNNKETQKIIE